MVFSSLQHAGEKIWPGKTEEVINIRVRDYTVFLS